MVETSAVIGHDEVRSLKAYVLYECRRQSSSMKVLRKVTDERVPGWSGWQSPLFPSQDPPRMRWSEDFSEK